MVQDQGGKGISRRKMMLLAGAGALTACVGSGVLFPGAAAAKSSAPTISPDTALKLLLEGNQRYVEGKLINADRSPADIRRLAKGQNPFAVVLGCSDSRVPPEIVFDQGLGDLFTVRVAGNFVEAGGLASIDYAVEHLGSPLVVVLGHRRCGAVTAVVDAIRAGKALPDDLSKFSEAIAPAIEPVKNRLGDMVDNGVRANIQYVTNQLKASQPVLAEFVRQGMVKVVGAYYNLDTGEVQFIV
ncbi:MAG: carbonic anhydrase [Leptolyngbyaceae bacterium]|nr:carbonic anhydrase [Leptolyngbyaceae bacterium]